MFGKGKHSIKKFGKKKTMVLVIALVCIALVSVVFGGKDKKQEVNIASTAFVTRGNVSKTISGSASVEPNERYEVLALVNGEILSAPFDVGDYVEEGAVLYEFDTTDVNLSLARQENSMEKSTITYNESLEQADDLNVRATCNGVIQEIFVQEGDEISQNKQVTTIINTRELKVKLPFNKAQVLEIYEGADAVLSSAETMSEFYGTVSNISGTATALADGTSVYYVTVNFTNPGAILAGDMLGGSVNGISSHGVGKVETTSDATINSSVSGTVSSIYYKEGDYVKKGDIILKIQSDNITNSLKRSRLEYEDAKLSLQDQRNKLDDYKLTAPISGTVLTKNSKQGDTIDRTNSSVTMMVIGDVSKLKFSLSIDELDVEKVKVGQQVNITADAIEGKTFMGVVSSIAMEGTATNGVTTYQAVVTIDDPQELKPSMNVDAVIVVESADDVLRVPSSDITTVMGKSYVFVKSEEKDQPKKPDAERPQDEKTFDGEKRMPDAPDGFIAVEIKTGVIGDEFTEVIEGLSEGMEIYQKAVSSSSNNMMFGMGMGMPGGMHGGMGMPGGMR